MFTILILINRKMKNIKFIKRESRKGFKIWDAFYSEKNMQLAVIESNLILNNIK